MKKALALILTLAMLLSLAACGGTPATTAAPTEAPKTTEAPATTAAPTTEAPTTEAPTEPAPQVVKTVYVMNGVLEGLPTYDDPLEVRFNPNWIRGWNVGKFAEDNFWFAPDEEKQVYVISYSDGYIYAGDLPYKTFKSQLIALDIPAELQESFPNAIVFGPDMPKDELPWKMGVVVCGPEAILLGKKKAWNAEELFTEKLGGADEVAKMVEADSYDFVCADGYAEEIAKEDLADVEIFFTEDGSRMDATSIAYPEYTLQDILYIVPHGVEKDKLPETVEDGIVYKITVFNTAVKESETDMIYPHGGSAQVGYKAQEVLAALEIGGSIGDVTTISRGDSAPVTCTADEFLARYIVLNDSKDRGPYTVGQNQTKGNVTLNVVLFDMGDYAMVYVPDDATKEAGLGIADILEKLGLADAKAVNVVCSDGYSEEIDAADFADAGIFHNDDRIDATSIAYPQYTLENAVKIEILK